MFRLITAAIEVPHLNLRVFDSTHTSLDILLLKSQDMVNGIMFNVEKLVKDLKSKTSLYQRIAGLSAGHQQKRTATGEYQAQRPSFGKTSGNRLYLCKPMRRMYGLLHADHAKADCIWTA